MRRYSFSKPEKDFALKVLKDAALANVSPLSSLKKTKFNAAKLSHVFLELMQADDYVTGDELWQTIHNKQEVTISIGSVYNYLYLLTEIGIVERQAGQNTFKPDQFRILPEARPQPANL